MSEIEKQFMEVFDIDNCRTCNYHGLECWECDDVYPQITDRILLELICITHASPVITFTSRNIEDLKEEVLIVLCNWVNHKDIKQQVQTLFMEKCTC